MSQASNKLKWCLNKAKKELENSDKHRGLVQKGPDDALARLHIGKAEHNLQAALFFAKHGYSDWSASAFFYSVYHSFLAVLAKFGYESRNQECTIAAIEVLREEGKIKIDEQFINTLKLDMKDGVEKSLIHIREDFQYGTEQEFKETEQFEMLAEICKDAISQTRDIVFK